MVNGNFYTVRNVRDVYAASFAFSAVREDGMVITWGRMQPMSVCFWAEVRSLERVHNV